MTLSNREKIQELLLISSLTPIERFEFLTILSGARDEDLEPLATLFAEDSSWIRKISQNYKSKQTAFAGKDKTAWAEILKKEEAQLKELEP